MTQRITLQHKIAAADNIKDLLIRLRSQFGFTNRALAARIGVNENYLSRVYNGGENPSQLFCHCIALLIELETLKLETESLRAGKAALRNFMLGADAKYPETAAGAGFGLSDHPGGAAETNLTPAQKIVDIVQKHASAALKKPKKKEPHP